jgi:hypothetical protein
VNPDFRDMLSALCAEGAEFLLVGAYALAAHGFPRATGDIDIWVRPTPENARHVWRAIVRFGAPHRELTVDDLCTPDVVFQIGVAPRRIDILTSISGVCFDDAWKDRMVREIEGLPVSILSRDHLRQNKKASGRPQDLADAAWLERQSS